MEPTVCICVHAAGYQPSVRDFEGLKALARRQGGDAASNRGACKICGGLGHLTKQCRNFLDNKAAEGAAAAAADGGDRQLLTADDDDALLLRSDSMRSSDLSGSDSGSSSDDGRVSAWFFALELQVFLVAVKHTNRRAVGASRGTVAVHTCMGTKVLDMPLSAYICHPQCCDSMMSSPTSILCCDESTRNCPNSFISCLLLACIQRKKRKKEKSKKHKKEKSKKHKREKSRKHRSSRDRSRSRSRSRDRTGRDRSRSRSPVRRH